VVGPTVPLDVITPICKSHNAKLVVIKDDASFVNINNSFSLALYKEILNDVKEVPIHLDDEGIKEALKVSQPCRLEPVPFETIKELAPGLDFYPTATYLDVAHNPEGIRKLTRAVKSIHGKDKKLKIYLITSINGTKDFILVPAFTAMYMHSNDVKVVIFDSKKLISLENAERIIEKAQMSGKLNSMSFCTANNPTLSCLS
jgi:folylpolyglutamate synthase/dihydropteroate synthase